ncbi:hypothetical protein [Paenibacillus luteus]|uniref:hypothetical protein n=1 Tax=Paenibacillus luteus TaxID=2545753 RepID=UPI0019D68BE4|nr:hypothetical protein [Paenibacillus luteus]
MRVKPHSLVPRRSCRNDKDGATLLSTKKSCRRDKEGATLLSTKKELPLGIDVNMLQELLHDCHVH